MNHIFGCNSPRSSSSPFYVFSHLPGFSPCCGSDLQLETWRGRRSPAGLPCGALRARLPAAAMSAALPRRAALSVASRARLSDGDFWPILFCLLTTSFFVFYLRLRFLLTISDATSDSALGVHILILNYNVTVTVVVVF